MTASVVVLDDAAVRDELVGQLGATRLRRLHELLVGRAVAWAEAAVGPAAVSVRRSREEDFGAAIEAAVGEEDEDGGPLLIAVPELVRWRPQIAEAALDDLAAGCAASLGPVFDGGFYLVAVNRPATALRVLPAGGWAGRDATGALIALAARERLELGLLRTERALRRPADVRSVLADPLTDSELRDLLGD